MSNNSDLEPRLPYTKVCSWPEPPPADQGEAASTTFAAASYWDYASDSVSSASTAGFDSTRAKVQEKFDIEAKPWQIGETWSLFLARMWRKLSCTKQFQS